MEHIDLNQAKPDTIKSFSKLTDYLEEAYNETATLKELVARDFKEFANPLMEIVQGLKRYRNLLANLPKLARSNHIEESEELCGMEPPWGNKDDACTFPKGHGGPHEGSGRETYARRARRPVLRLGNHVYPEAYAVIFKTKNKFTEEQLQNALLEQIREIQRKDYPGMPIYRRKMVKLAIRQHLKNGLLTQDVRGLFSYHGAV